MAISILSAVEAAGKLFGGYGTLTLGPVTFTGLELPAKMPIGGKQAVAVHDLPGGKRYVDTLGPREGAIHWKGCFYGTRQTERARALDRLRQSGKSVRLVWGNFSYQVIVVSFECDTKIIGPMPYRIHCLVVKNATNPTGVSLAGLAPQVLNDIEAAQPLAAAASLMQGVSVPGLAAAASTTGAAQLALAEPGALKAATSLFASATKDINTAAAAIRTARQQADSVIAQVATPLAQAIGVSPNDFTVSSLTGAISEAASAAGISANLQASHGYIARIAANMLRASS